MARLERLQTEEFARRRRQLMRMMGKDGIAILPAAPVRHRNDDIEYPYRQDSDFHYLTGFRRAGGGRGAGARAAAGRYILFVRERDPAARDLGRAARRSGRARWHSFGADDAFPIADIDEILPGLLENRAQVYYTMGSPSGVRPARGRLGQGLRAQARTGRHPPQEFVALDHVLHDMRLYKSRAELR